MICNNCNKENRTDGRFCRFCGSKLSQNKVSFSIKLPDFSGLVSVIRKQNKKAAIIALLVVIGGAGTAFAAPKINDYIKVNGLISEALELESAGDYQAALASLVVAQDKWTLESKRQEIEDLKEAQAKYAQYKQDFEVALEMEESGKLADARELLQSIEADYPEYKNVKEKISELQEAIENDLREQARAQELEAQRQAAAAAEARRQAKAEAAAKARAEAEKASSEAQAAAAAAAARQAEAQKQQAEAEQERQVRISFLNQLSSLYGTYNGDGIDYYNSGMSYYNSGSELTALTVFGQARAVFQNTYSQAASLNSNFSNMPSSYTQAATNMKNAAYYALEATDEVISVIGTYNSSNANYYGDLAESYGSKVRSFLTSQGY